MQWIKEVDDLRSSSSIRGISMPNFEVLDARIASALNKIIHNSHFKRKISLEEQKTQKEDRFLRGRQIAYLIYEQFRVTGTDDSVENYTDLFTIALRNDDIQEFDSKWDGILLSMTKILPDDILEGLYKLRIRESEKLKTVLELYDLETHQKKLGPDYHRLKTMVKRSIEQEIRIKNFGARIGNFEKNAVVKNQGTKQRVQRILGDCWQWETNGQCVKGTIAALMGQETCLIHGQVSHNLLYWKKKLLTDICGPGGEIDEEAAYIQARSSMARVMEVNGKERQAEGRQKWAEETLHLENARKLRGIYFIDPEDTQFKETIKNARKKLETSVALAMPCKIMKNCGSGASNKIKTKLACILESDESTRMHMGNSIPHHHEDHIAGKGENSLQHYNLVHKFILMPQAMKIPAAKAAVDKECEKLEKISAWNLTKVKSKKQVIDEARTSGATVHFASLMDICHLKNAELEAKHQKYKRSSCSPR